MVDRIARMFAPRWMLLRDLRNIAAERISIPIQGVCVSPNLVDVLGHLSFVKRDSVVTKIEMEDSGPSIRLAITEIAGLFAGRTTDHTGEYLPSFYDLGRTLTTTYNKPNRIGFETEEDFERNIHYLKENLWRITGVTDSPVFPLVHREWDDKYFILNYDGAHHLSAIYRQCREQNREFYLDCEVRQVLQLNVEGLHRLCGCQCFLILHRKTAEALISVLDKFGMARFWTSVGDFHAHKTILALSRDAWQTKLAYNLIVSEFPKATFIDLSSYYAGLLS